jgi:hypothetical protein
MERINDLIRAHCTRPDILRDFAQWCAARAHRADMSVNGSRLGARAASDAAARAAARYSTALPHLMVCNAIDAAGYARAAAALSAGRCTKARDAANDAEHNAQREHMRALVAR